MREVSRTRVCRRGRAIVWQRLPRRLRLQKAFVLGGRAVGWTVVNYMLATRQTPPQAWQCVAGARRVACIQVTLLRTNGHTGNGCAGFDVAMLRLRCKRPEQRLARQSSLYRGNEIDGERDFPATLYWRAHWPLEQQRIANCQHRGSAA